MKTILTALGVVGGQLYPLPADNSRPRHAALITQSAIRRLRLELTLRSLRQCPAL
jgi:hypothetical protein